MPSNSDYNILKLRNEASLCLDDLVALIVNSTLAQQLRSFSNEVMDLTPGFTFNQKQAKALLDTTQKTYKSYKGNKATDTDLLEYLTNAQAIIKGDTQMNGGNDMGFLGKVFQSKEQKQKEAVEATSKNYQNVCRQIVAAQEKMELCIRESQGHSPESIIYRNNERAYNTEKNRLTLLKKREISLRKVLEDYEKIELIKAFDEEQKKLVKTLPLIMGSEKERETLLVQVDLNEEKIDSATRNVENFGQSLFESSTDEYNVSTNSEFGSLVASGERRDMLTQMPGNSNAAEESKSEFASFVSGAEKRNEA